jgi:putative ABC transport system ATP-binding protein
MSEEALMPIVECRGVRKTYRAGKVPVPALSGVDLAVDRGEFTAIAGPSGSGKTTLLNLIGALDIPTDGAVFVAGRNLFAETRAQLSELRRRHLGFVFQAFNLIPVFSALENVEFILMVQGVGRAERRRRALDILERVGLADMMHRRPNELSGGQQQRVAVARAIVSRPDLILADEPTANLDSQTGASLMDLMVRLNETEGMTFLFSSHDRMVMERSRRLLLLCDGRIVEDRH